MVMVLLLRLAMTTETPIELRVRMSVHGVLPLRSAAGMAASEMVFSGTNMKPSPAPAGC